jgi:hypothetical protein
MVKEPVQEIRMGLIKATIWENETASGPRYSVAVARLYRNGDRWVESTRFGRDDLPLLAKVVDFAHTWIFTQAGAKTATSAKEQ